MLNNSLTKKANKRKILTEISLKIKYEQKKILLSKIIISLIEMQMWRNNRVLLPLIKAAVYSAKPALLC